MKTLSGVIKLLVLVPHRDARRLLRSWSAALFAAGQEGAWSFPHAAPLAVLERPLNTEELKHCAAALRSVSLLEKRGGKIKSGAAASAIFPNAASGEKSAITLFGPVLDLDVPDSAFSANAAQKIMYRFPRLLLGTCIEKEKPAAAMPPVPALAFRAAALANMSYRLVEQLGGENAQGGFLAEWRMGKLQWLPPVQKA